MFIHCMLNHANRKNVMSLAHRATRFDMFCFKNKKYSDLFRVNLQRIYKMIKNAERAQYSVDCRVLTMQELIELIDITREVNQIVEHTQRKTLDVKIKIDDHEFSYTHDLKHEFCAYNIHVTYARHVESLTA